MIEKFTEEELEELKRFDAQIDNEELTFDDYRQTDFIEKEFLFPRDERQRKKSDYRKRYYEKNKERIAAYKKQWRERNKERIAAYNKQYQENNKERISACKKQYYEKNKARHAAHMRQWRKNKKLHATDKLQNTQEG